MRQTSWRVLDRKYRMYTAQEAAIIFKMLHDVGSRELALSTLLYSRKRFQEFDRRALFRELNLLKRTLGNAYYRWGYQSSQMMWTSSGVLQTLYSEEDQALLEDVKKVEWLHNKKAYESTGWQEQHRKKEYRRSAKNHYS